MQLVSSLALAAGLLFSSVIASAALAEQMPPQQYATLGNLKLESGASIRDCKLGYRTFGKLNADRSNAVLFPTWFTGHSGESGALVAAGPGHIVDDTKYYVIVVDSIGNGASCSPSNSATQHGIAFPAYTIHDMVESEYRLLTETLHLDHVHAVVGQSMGGMQAFEWVVAYPTFMDVAVPIVGTPQQSPYDLLLWNAEKVAIERDPDWKGGRYTRSPSLPMVSYIHEMNLATPQFRAEHLTREQFPAYFKRISEDYHVGVDANDYRSQLQAMITQDIAHGGTLYTAAGKIKAKMLVINARQDHMVNPLIPQGFARLLHAQTVLLESDCGHMSPGCDMAKISPIIDTFLAQK